MNRRLLIFKLLAAGLMTPGISLPLWAGTKNAQAQAIGKAKTSSNRPLTAQIKVYRSPTCGCCGAWVRHMQVNGFHTHVQMTENMEAIKRHYGIPQSLASCHTGLVEGYVVEGHVPAEDVWRLLQERPAIAGLIVPDMPLGSPGMEQGNHRDPYTVFAVTKMGAIAVFAKHT